MDPGALRITESRFVSDSPSLLEEGPRPIGQPGALPAIDAEWPALREAFLAWLDPSNFDGDGQQHTRLSDRTRPLLKQRGRGHDTAMPKRLPRAGSRSGNRH